MARAARGELLDCNGSILLCEIKDARGCVCCIERRSWCVCPCALATVSDFDSEILPL